MTGSFDARELVFLSEKLLNAFGDGEMPKDYGFGRQAIYRAVISRAYYGVLISAREAKGLSTKGDNGHSRVIAEYNNGNLDEQELGGLLEGLKKDRNAADYNVDEKYTKKQVLLVVGKARMGLGLLDKIHND